MREKFLIVSLGSIGRRHLSNLRMLRPNAEIGALRLDSPESAKGMPDDLDVQFYTLDAAISFSPKCAIIAAPASVHVKVAQAFADARIPMLLEKPIATSCVDTRALIDTCMTRNLTIMTGYNLRFLPSLREVKRLLESGCVGQVLGVRAEVGQYLPDWRPASQYQKTVSAQQRLGGGALLELSHEIDYLYWFFGLPRTVTARGGRYSELEIDVEDMVNLCLEYDNPRRLVSVHMDFLQRAPTRNCKFIGEKGTLIWNGITDEIDLFCPDNGDWRKIEGFRQQDRNQMYLDELTHFLECVEQNQNVLIDGVQGYNVLAIVDAAKTSIASDSTVSIEGYAKN